MTEAPDSQPSASCKLVDPKHLCAVRLCINRSTAIPATCCDYLVVLIEKLVAKAVQAEHARLLEIEAADWRPCFGAEAPTDARIRQEKIITVASTRALIALLNSRPNSQEGS